MGFMNPCLETNILPTWQERGGKKKHLEHRAAFRCTRPWAVTEFVWIPLIHARLAKPSGQETWKSRGAEGAGGRKDGIHQGGKGTERGGDNVPQKNSTATIFLIGRGTFEMKRWENWELQPGRNVSNRLWGFTAPQWTDRQSVSAAARFRKKVQRCDAGRPPAAIRGVKSTDTCVKKILW